MTTEDFWHFVRRAHAGGRFEAALLATLTADLQRAGQRTITAFEQKLREQVARLDTASLRDVATQLWVLSDDDWLHFRAWCVSQGADFVHQLETAPGRVLRDIAAGGGPFEPPNGELFLYCADYARVAGAKAVA